jgi:HlyD family secretion protein
MRKLALAAVCLIGVVALLGLTIDVQSRVPADRLDRTPEPSLIFASGRIEGATSEIELRPQLAGRIAQVLVSEGQTVNAGGVLLQLDDRQHRQESALAEAELALAEAHLDRLLNGAHPQERNEAAAICRAREAELQRAEITWQRIEDLWRANAIARQEADNQWMQVATLRSQLEAARARLALLEAQARSDDVRIQRAGVAAAKARLELAKVQADRTRLLAPCHAEVLKVNGKPGELAGPGSIEPAIVLADTSQYYVRAFVEELDAPRVNLGMAVKVVIDGLHSRELPGRIARLSPRMERKNLWSDRPTERYDTKTREVWIDLGSPKGLVIGLRVEVTIDTHSATSCPAATSREASTGSANGGGGRIPRPHADRTP